MRHLLLALVCMAAAVSTGAADGTPQPKYPPSFDCSAVPAGSQRQACNRSQLNPPMGPIPETMRAKPERTIRKPDAQPLPTTRPPTIPRLPGTIDPNN